MIVRVDQLMFGMIAVCVIIVTLCNVLVDYPHEEMPVTFKNANMTSVIVHAVAALNALFDLLIQKDNKAFLWPVFVGVHFVPNVLISLGLLRVGVIPLVQYFQHFCSLLLGEYLVHSMSFLQDVSSREFGKFFFFLTLACFFACLYNVGSIVFPEFRYVFKAISTTFTALFHVLIGKGLLDLVQASFQSRSVIHYDGTSRKLLVVNLFVMFTASLLPIVDLISYESQVMFFPPTAQNLYVLEAIMAVLMTEMFLARCFQTRLALVNLQHEHQHNRRITRSISHEIRTPLNTAFMALELLRDSMKNKANHGMIGMNGIALEKRESPEAGSEDWLETVDNIRDACNISLNILNQLLTFDKLNEQKLQLEQLLCPVLPIIDSNAKLFKIQAMQSGIKFKVQVRENERKLLSSLFLFVDEPKINQVLRNFLSNAMKFTPRRGTVEIYAEFVRASDERHNDSSEREKRHVARAFHRVNPCPSSVQCVSPRSPSFVVKAIDALQTSRLGLLVELFRGGFTNAAIAPSDSEFVSSSLSVAGVKQVGKIVLSIVDSGPGVAVEDQAKLFQEYVQINPGELQKGQGSGLGLSISKAIVALHGGRIGMHSEGKDCGSTFFVELPAYALPTHALSCSTDLNPSHDSLDVDISQMLGSMVDQSEIRDRVGSLCEIAAAPLRVPDSPCSLPTTPIASLSSKSAKSAAKSLSFLVVDDAAANRKLLARLLCRDGHRVFEAKDGAEAVFFMRSLFARESVKDDLLVNTTHWSGESSEPSGLAPPTHIDVILMDNYMVCLNGPAATTAIRSLGFDGPVIGITGALDDEADEFLKAGADLVLQKPVDMKSVMQALRSLKIF